MRSTKAVLRFLTVLLAGATSAAAWKRSEEENQLLFSRWLLNHGKSYTTIESKEHRFEVFKDNLQYIDEHNAAADNGVHTFLLGLNRFSDLTNEEYRSQFLAARRRRRRLAGIDRHSPIDGETLPDSIDWRKKGAVGPIKDQGNCGSGWAFSATAAVEGINQIVAGDLIALSEQELVDCDVGFNEGCGGGLADYAFEFIINNGGIDAEAHYPYNGRDGQCDLERKNASVVSIDDYVQVWSCNEKVLKKAVANQPVSVSIDGGGRNFQLYKSVLFLNNRLSGCLPAEIGQLKKATVFDAGFNQLTGPIPFSFGCLFKLEQLNLAFNNLYGEVPDVLCRLGQSEVGKLLNLSLSENYFTKIGPSCWTLIKKGGVLDVRRNCVPGLPNQRSPAECAAFLSHCPVCPLTEYMPCKYPSLTGGDDVVVPAYSFYSALRP